MTIILHSPDSCIHLAHKMWQSGLTVYVPSVRYTIIRYLNGRDDAFLEETVYPFLDSKRIDYSTPPAKEIDDYKLDYLLRKQIFDFSIPIEKRIATVIFQGQNRYNNYPWYFSHAETYFEQVSQQNWLRLVCSNMFTIYQLVEINRVLEMHYINQIRQTLSFLQKTSPESVNELLRETTSQRKMFQQNRNFFSYMLVSTMFQMYLQPKRQKPFAQENYLQLAHDTFTAVIQDELPNEDEHFFPDMLIFTGELLLGRNDPEALELLAKVRIRIHGFRDVE